MNPKFILFGLVIMFLGACSTKEIDFPAQYVFDKAELNSQSIFAYQNDVAKAVNPTTGTFVDQNRQIRDSFDTIFDQLNTMFPFVFQSIELVDEKTVKVMNSAGDVLTLPYEKLSDNIIQIENSIQLKMEENTLAQCVVMGIVGGKSKSGMAFNLPDFTACLFTDSHVEIAKKYYDQYTATGSKVDTIAVSPIDIRYKRK